MPARHQPRQNTIRSSADKQVKEEGGEQDATHHLSINADSPPAMTHYPCFPVDHPLVTCNALSLACNATTHYPWLPVDYPFTTILWTNLQFPAMPINMRAENIFLSRLFFPLNKLMSGQKELGQWTAALPVPCNVVTILSCWLSLYLHRVSLNPIRLGEEGDYY